MQDPLDLPSPVKITHLPNGPLPIVTTPRILQAQKTSAF
jgi:hypothetical protein